MLDKKTEWKMLFEANAKLNSPEAVAFHKELAELQRRCDDVIKSMGFNNLDDLAKAQLEADAQLRLFHETQTEDHSDILFPAALPRR